jgi:acyl-CoA-dependent ceramide synthase
MSGTFKWYYLVQFSFWVQQILVIHLEARRKDHAQMLIHHIITCTLICVTYVYRYYRVANVVLCLMDVVDFLLPVSEATLSRASLVIIFSLFLLPSLVTCCQILIAF